MPAEFGGGSLPFAYNNFDGGFNSLLAPDLLADNEARDLQNLQGTTAGAIVKRTGLSTFASPASTFTSLAPSEATTSLFLIGAAGTALYSVSTGGTVTAINDAALTAGKRWEWISAATASGQGPMFGMNGTDTPRQWTGSGNTAAWTATDGGSVPNGTYCIYHRNQVFVAGVAANPSRLYWSGLANPTQWNAGALNGAGFADFDPGDGQAITGLGVIGPYVLVCKPRKLFILVDPASATIRTLSESIGCVSHRSIAAGAEGTYLLAEDRGVYLVNQSKIVPISDKIQPTIDSITGSRSNAAGAYINAHYYLSVPLNSSTNDTVLDFDAKLDSWWKHTFGSNQFAVWHPTGSAQLYSAKATSAIVDQCFVPNLYTDNGSNYTWIWRGPWMSPTFYRRRRFPTPWFRKRIRQMRIRGFGAVDLYLAKDFTGLESLVEANLYGPQQGGTFGAADGTVFGANDGSLFGAPSSLLAIVYGQGVANAWSVVVSSTSSSSDGVYEIVMALTDRRDLVPA
jgi:hypothetical protein